MTTATVAASAPIAARSATRASSRVAKATEFFLLATAFCCTFEKVHWNVAGNVEITDILTFCFLVAFAATRRARATRTVAIVGVFFAVFLLVYLIGFFNIETQQSLNLFGKGMVKFLLHFLLLGSAIAYLAASPERRYWRALAAFTAGMVFNGIYGILQLLAARAGTNLDSVLLSPLTGGASSINIYGSVNGQSVYRPNALTGDPNHLGVMLVIPLLTLLPVYLRLEKRHRLKVPLAVTLAFLLLVELATLSRSGLLGLGAGLLVLALPYRRFAFSRALLLPLAGFVVVLLGIIWEKRHFFSVVIRSRLQTGGGSENAHLFVYTFIPKILHSHPLLGLGLNTFSVYYEFVTGKANWGPHSFYVALFVETGIVGALVFFVFLGWIFLRLRSAERLGRTLAALRDPVSRRVRPLAWGMTAALVGSMAANLFYLTLSFYYFYVFAALALALPVVFGRRLSVTRGS
jgi:O-antigen ligase